ncbi:hypothetical protein RDI58_024645 [Solanum bulbocastanum]|uniref:Uncharacterized protein n=1 Tax=Solanum bulbocastanum TaxID=147425 RepID=A0AAN8Y3N0_SOLBU
MQYSIWLANVVPIAKKYEKIIIYVDYRDLNKPSPKDNFPCRTFTSSLIIVLGMRCNRLWIAMRVITRY